MLGVVNNLSFWVAIITCKVELERGPLSVGVRLEEEMELGGGGGVGGVGEFPCANKEPDCSIGQPSRRVEVGEVKGCSTRCTGKGTSGLGLDAPVPVSVSTALPVIIFRICTNCTTCTDIIYLT